MTQSKRILLTKAMLEDIGYKDMKCLDLHEHDRGDIFKAQYKPVAMTLEQLQRDPQKVQRAHFDVNGVCWEWRS